MKERIFKASIVLNVFIVAASAIGYFFFRDFISRVFVINNRSKRLRSFFHWFPVESDDVVFLGDSITEEGRWSEMFPNKKVRNRGISADRTCDVLNRLDQVTAGQPHKVFLLIGTNDLGTGVPQWEIVRNYRCILAAFKKKSPNTQVFVQSVLPRRAKFRKRVEALNLALRGLAKDFGHDYIDLYPDYLGCDGSIDNQYAADELHLNGAGYEKWRSLIAPYV